MKGTLFIAADHGGFVLKEKLKTYLGKRGLLIKDLGTCSEESCDYPLYAYALAKKIAAIKRSRGILICKSGIGNSIVANRVPGVRAALCYNIKAAESSRRHNDSNVLVLGSLFVNYAQAEKITDIWLKTEFEGGRHKRRIDEITKIEREIRDGIFKTR